MSTMSSCLRQYIGIFEVFSLSVKHILERLLWSTCDDADP